MQTYQNNYVASPASSSAGSRTSPRPGELNAPRPGELNSRKYPGFKNEPFHEDKSGSKRLQIDFEARGHFLKIFWGGCPEGQIRSPGSTSRWLWLTKVDSLSCKMQIRHQNVNFTMCFWRSASRRSLFTATSGLSSSAGFKKVGKTCIFVEKMITNY